MVFTKLSYDKLIRLKRFNVHVLTYTLGDATATSSLVMCNLRPGLIPPVTPVKLDETKCAAVRENLSGFPTRPNTNRPVQSKKQARSLKFRI